MRPTIVIGSRNADLCFMARHFLEQSGFKTYLYNTAVATAAAALRHGVRGVVVDGGLYACIKACQHITEQRSSSEITVVAILDRKFVRQEMAFLSAGADEVFARPFSLTRIVRAFNAKGAGLQLAYGDIELDVGARRVWRGTLLIDLPKIEFAILHLFMLRPEHVFSRRDIIAACWPSGIFVDPRTVNVHIASLRKSLRVNDLRDPIRSVRGTGYGMEFPM